MTGSRPAPSPRSLAFAVTVLLGLLALLLLEAGPASAHASLVRVDPAEGSTVATAPSKVTLTFDENVRAPAVIVVTGPDGTRVSTGTPAVLDNTASTAVDISKGGVYTVAFRVVSADGHPAAERTTFRVAGGTASSPTSSPQATTADAQTSAADGGDGSRRRTWFIASVAGAALLGGLALLSPGRRGSPARGRAGERA